MEFIACDADKMESFSIPDSMSIDIDIGDTNDFEIKCQRSDGLDFGMWLICPGTEYGGILEQCQETTSDTAVTWAGCTFRGLLEQFIIQPDEGEDYYTVSGDAHDIMREVLGEAFGGVFTVPEETSGIAVKSYSFNRYTDALSGFTKMLSAYDARIEITVVQGGPNAAFTVELMAVPVQNLAEEIEYSQDSGISVSLAKRQYGITHLICLGQGDLAERMVRHLYLQADGTVGTGQYYTGLEERTAVYDYSSAESEDELVSGGEEYLLGLTIPSQTMEMSVDDEDTDLQVGDFIAGRNYETGLYLVEPVTQKIIKVSDGYVTISYNVEGSE